MLTSSTLRPFRVLLQHFLRQFWSLESVSTGGDLKEGLIAVLSVMAGPGLLAAMLAVYHSPVTAYRHKLDGLDPLLWYWSEEWLLFSMSFVVTGVLAAIQWRSLVLGSRDFRILGPLPLPRRTVLRAKLLSVLVLLVAVHASVNLLGGLVLPLVSPLGVFRAAGALQLALLTQTVFVCAAVIALQSAATLVVPPLFAERVASAVQTVLLLGFGLVLAAQDVLAELAVRVRDVPHPLHTCVPVFWFMGQYKQMLGDPGAQTAADARLAVGMTLVSLLAAVPLSLLGYQDGEGRRPRIARTLLSLSAVLDVKLAWRHPRHPVSRAVSAFVSKTFSGCAVSTLIARGFLVLGVGVILAGFGGTLLRGERISLAPGPAMLAPVFILPFFALVGFRAAAGYPAVLEANWIFRVTEVRGSREYMGGIRAAAVRRVAPLLAFALVGYSVLWGFGFALAVVAWALAIALLTIEWLFFGFPKIPFTCSYLPGKARMRARWPYAFVVTTFYCGALPLIASWALRGPEPWLHGLVILSAAWLVLLALHSRERGLDAPLVFDDQPIPLVTPLGLGS